LMIHDPLFSKSGPKIAGETFGQSCGYVLTIVVHLFLAPVDALHGIVFVTILMSHIAVKLVKSPIERMAGPSIPANFPSVVPLKSPLSHGDGVISCFLHDIGHGIIIC